MINLDLFYALLRAIPSGSKVICLGDNGQLEAIGSGNLAYDMLTSEEVPSVTLNKIHRQAEDSAIVTESVKIRNKTQIVPKDWVGQEVRGKLQDLNITCYSDISNTYYEIMKRFSAVYDENKNIMNIQVIVPTKFKGACTYMLNNAIQEICNPKNKRTEEIVQTIDKNHPYVLRVGDKVICTKNNYKVYPNIYNGNTGFLKGFTEEEVCNKMGDFVRKNVMIVDFVGIGEVHVPQDYWNSIELAYALTCHKCQGSESEIVIFGLDFSSYSLLSKELVYTGITRAKKMCYLIAQTNALRYATGNSSVVQKQTHLRKCLHDLFHPTVIF